MNTFEQAWKIYTDAGYQYGKDALEQVRLGWNIARGALPRGAQPKPIDKRAPPQTMRVHDEEACDTVDAMVFSGDALEDPGNLRRFEWWVQRWQRAIDNRKALTAYNAQNQIQRRFEAHPPCSRDDPFNDD